MLRKLFNVTWRIIVCGFVFASGLIASRIVLQLAGVSAPRMPNQAPENIAGWYLLAGSIALATGVFPVFRNIRGSFLVRWLVLATFLFTGFSVSTTIEASIFSRTIGIAQMIGVMFLPCLLLAGLGAVLFKPSPPELPPKLSVADTLRGMTRSQRTVRIVLAIIAFPLTYFIFGVIVSPLVTPYYEQGIASLVLPEPGIIVYTQLLRGGIHLLAVLPLMFSWNASLRRLVLSLGLAFFMFVTAYDFVLAYQVPTVLVVIHGIEVLASSFVYALSLVSALARGRTVKVSKAV